MRVRCGHPNCSQQSALGRSQLAASSGIFLVGGSPVGRIAVARFWQCFPEIEAAGNARRTSYVFWNALARTWVAFGGC
jgi:hypothetical protein